MSFRFRSVALVLAISSAAVAAQTRAARVVEIHVFGINDFHGALEPPTGANGRIGDADAGGAVYLATHLKRDIAAHPHSIVVAAGDLIGASPLLSSLAHNEPTIDALNAMHLAISSVGNHEFDRGWRELLRMQKGGGRSFLGARFQYLAANVVRTTPRGDEPLLPATAVRTIAGVKIGFIGETLRDTPKMLSAAAQNELSFLDEAEVANRLAAGLQRQGVNTIVLLIHEGGRQAAEDANANPNGCDDFGGAIIPIVRKLSPAIRVVLSGHTHRAYNCLIDGHRVTSAASLGRIVTHLTLSVDASSGETTNLVAVNEIVTRDVEPDAAQAAIVAHYSAFTAPIARRPVGSIASPVARQLNGAGEGVLGDVIADAFLASARELAGGADIAFMNEGGVRADLTSTTVNYNDLFNVLPFGNTVLAMNIDGRTLKDLLEQQFDNPRQGQRAILQISEGFTYRYAVDAPAGQHVDSASITLNGKRVLPTDRVRIAASDFLHTGGNGFTVFERGSDLLSAGLDIDALQAYIKAHSPLAAPSTNRIIRTD